MNRIKRILAHPLTIIAIGLSAMLMAQQPRLDGISCTVEVLSAPHGASQHGPMVSGGSYRAEVVIDPGVYFCVDGTGVTHAVPFRPVQGRCRK